MRGHLDILLGVPWSTDCELGYYLWGPSFYRALESYRALSKLPDRQICREPALYAGGLVVAALIYVGFSLTQPGWPWLWIEGAGVVLFTALAMSWRCCPKWLAVGWGGHVVWDVWLHQGEAFVPSWYPLACVGFDLLMAAYIAVRAHSWSR